MVVGPTRLKKILLPSGSLIKVHSGLKVKQNKIKDLKTHTNKKCPPFICDVLYWVLSQEHHHVKEKTG